MIASYFNIQSTKCIEFIDKPKYAVAFVDASDASESIETK